MSPNGNIVKCPFGNSFMVKGANLASLAGRIAIARGSRTQDEFAAATGVGRTTLIRYENGERVPDADFLCAVVEETGVDASWLLMGGDRHEAPRLTAEEHELLGLYRAAPLVGKMAAVGALQGALAPGGSRAKFHTGSGVGQQADVIRQNGVTINVGGKRRK